VITTLYKYSLSIWGGLLIIASVILLWKNQAHTPVNFVVGDAGDYYSYLTSFFIHHDLANQKGDVWYLLKTTEGTLNVHPVGESILLLPFFGLGCLLAFIFGSEVNGLSAPFQISLALAAISYVLLGLYFLKQLLQENGHTTKAILITLTLILFGTNLFNYTIFEACMSHVYSFALISMFLYYTYIYVKNLESKNIYKALLLLGLIVLLRPNNGLIVCSIFIWMNNWQQTKEIILHTLKTRAFYKGLVLTLAIISLQSWIWLYQSGQFLNDTYKADGFYWGNPQIFKMLFGFDNGFFIYTPLCLVLLFGLVPLFKKNRFKFWSAIIFLSGLIYFFASYWGYTYFDGLGIRVLVDYYALFTIIGAKLTELILESKIASLLASPLAIFLVILNLIYCYQNNRAIILRAGMNFEQWKYTFLKVGKKYHGCLGGANDLVPYAKNHPKAFITQAADINTEFDFNGKEYGLSINKDSLGVKANRLHFQIELTRTEAKPNTSKNALLCINIEHKNKSQALFYTVRLNETPSDNNSPLSKSYTYHVNVGGDFKNDDKLTLYIWNRTKKAFKISTFKYQLFNYSYNIN
jgi:hypothetical protein